MHTPRTLLAAAAVAAAALLGACGGDDATAGPTSSPTAAPDGGVEVVGKIAGFSPDVVEIAVGDTVTWVFDDGSIPHNVKASGDAFHSPTLTDDRWSHTFDEAGTYRYICTLHPSMVGTVTVTATGPDGEQ